MKDNYKGFVNYKRPKKDTCYCYCYLERPHASQQQLACVYDQGAGMNVFDAQ